MNIDRLYTWGPSDSSSEDLLALLFKTKEEATSDMIEWGYGSKQPMFVYEISIKVLSSHIGKKKIIEKKRNKK